jgi:Uncharacterised protein family (UPF0014)
MRQAIPDLLGVAVADALFPALDQTRTPGLVILPGAFARALFGVPGPLAAARFHLLSTGRPARCREHHRSGPPAAAGRSPDLPAATTSGTAVAGSKHPDVRPPLSESRSLKP